MIRRLIDRIERRITRGWNFVADVAYYVGRGHRIGRAIELARNTL